MPVMGASELVPAGGLVDLRGPERDLVAAWLAGFRGATRSAYARDVAHFAAWCREHGLALVAVKRPHAELYARELEERDHRAPATIARRLAALSSFYGYLVDEGVLSRSPLERVRRPRLSADSSTLGLDRGELGRLLAAAEADGPLAHALICLLALNGLRVSEAVGIRVGDLDTERGHRVVRITRKGGKVAIVPLAPRTAGAVDELGESSKDLLCADADRPVPVAHRLLFGVDRHGAFRLVRRLVASAGIRKRLGPHSLRHTFVTLSLDAGVPLRDVQAAAGHADPKTTMRYDRARLSLERAATYRLASYVTD